MYNLPKTLKTLSNNPKTITELYSNLLTENLTNRLPENSRR